jgi:hypothetical protein
MGHPAMSEPGADYGEFVFGRQAPVEAPDSPSDFDGIGNRT